MEQEQIIKVQEQVTAEVERLSKDTNYLSKTRDADHPEKLNPYVVAILVGNKKSIMSYRSELFNGDHAEYNLFLQKLSGEDHSGDILFVSLEPCNHDSRLKTISCSELIVKAGIKKVYMGTFDPDPMVRGDGYAYLRANHVDVELFDENFQTRLIDVNKDFYIKKLIEDESLSRFIKKYKDNFDINAIAFDALSKARSVNLAKGIDSVLKAIELYKEDHNEDIFELFYKMSKENHYIDEIVANSKRDFWFDDGYKLAFYKNPNSLFKGAYIRVINNISAEEKPSLTFKGPIFMNVLRAASYIYGELKKIVSSKDWDIVYGIVREMIVNAVCHKNYDSYSPVIVKLNSNLIEIYNPFVVNKVAVDKLNEFKMPTNPINGCLTDIAINEGFMEGQGRGTADLEKYVESVEKNQKAVYEAVCDILITKIPLPTK